MNYARIALLSAAASCWLPFATPALAQLSIEHPPACARCGEVYSTAPSPGYHYEGVPGIGSELRMGVPPGATALAPERGVAGVPLANGCHVEDWEHTGSFPPRYTATCP